MTPNRKKTGSLFEIRSLREQVYDYLRSEMHDGRILPGSYINMNEISQTLGISKTPLRDALIQFECEGFVTIQPRRGILVNKLTIEDVKYILEVVGTLESAVILAVFDFILPRHIKKLESLNQTMTSAVEREDFDTYYKLNIAFHDVFLDLNQTMTAAVEREDFDTYYKLNIAFHDVFLRLNKNQEIHRIVTPLKQRLYDFPRRTYIKEWELINCGEHQKLIAFIKDGKPEQASRLWRDSHWSFKAYEKFIRRFYADSEETITSHLAWR